MDILVAWILRALSRFLQSRAPALATRMGLGSERTEKLSDRPADLIGRTGRVESELIAGKGRVLVDGISWAADGETASVGSSVRIIGVEGNRLKVRKA